MLALLARLFGQAQPTRYPDVEDSERRMAELRRKYGAASDAELFERAAPYMQGGSKSRDDNRR